MRWVLGATLAAALATSLPARAGDAAAGEAAYNAGMELANQGRWAEACPKFLASFEVDPQLGAVLHLADCYERVGKLASAWARFKEGLELARKLEDDRASTVEGRIAKLEARLPRLRIDVARPDPALTVERDGEVVQPATFGLPVPVDPGPVAIAVLRGPDELERRKAVGVEGQLAVVKLDLAAISAAHPPPNTAPKPRKPYDPTQRYAGLGLGGAGIVVTLVAGGLEIGALVKKGQANDPSACVDKECTSAGFKAAQSGATLAQAGQWLGIGGLVVLATGVVVFATAPSPPKEKEPAIVPWFDLRGGGAAWSGTF